MKQKTIGKYFLDKIDGVVYSTNSYSLYIMYNNLFYEEKKEKDSSRELQLKGD